MMMNPRTSDRERVVAHGIGTNSTSSGDGMLSYRAATTWLIAACVIIFMLDRVVLPMQWVDTGELIESKHTIKRDRTKDVVLKDQPPVKESFDFEDGASRDVIAWPVVNEDARGVVAYRVVHQMHFLESLLHFSTDRGFLRLEFWRLIGYQFLHSQHLPVHIVLNMIGLFFFGPMVEAELGRKRFVAFYLLCGIFGALMYVTLNLGGVMAESIFGESIHIPGLIFSEKHHALIGASGSVFGVLMAGAYLDPDARVLLFFIVPMRLVTLAYGLVAVAMFSIILGTENAGGEAAHLGGALAGYYFIRHPHHLHDFFDVMGRVDPTSHHYRKQRVSANADD